MASSANLAACSAGISPLLELSVEKKADPTRVKGARARAEASGIGIDGLSTGKRTLHSSCNNGGSSAGTALKGATGRS